MELSKRLQMVADCVRYSRVADIGTDHGYLPIYLALEGRLISGVACDVRRGPLEKAKENIRFYGLGNKISARLGDGLFPVEPEEVDCAVIAGMGGMLMIDILKRGVHITSSLKQLVLQPQRDIPAVRRYLHQAGYRIEKEDMVREDGKYYTAISAVWGNETYQKEEEYLFGKMLIEEKHPVLKQYLTERLHKIEHILDISRHSVSENGREKRQLLCQEQKLCKEVLEWL